MYSTTLRIFTCTQTNLPSTTPAFHPNILHPLNEIQGANNTTFTQRAINFTHQITSWRIITTSWCCSWSNRPFLGFQICLEKKIAPIFWAKKNTEIWGEGGWIDFLCWISCIWFLFWGEDVWDLPTQKKMYVFCLQTNDHFGQFFFWSKNRKGYWKTIFGNSDGKRTVSVRKTAENVWF